MRNGPESIYHFSVGPLEIPEVMFSLLDQEVRYNPAFVINGAVRRRSLADLDEISKNILAGSLSDRLGIISWMMHGKDLVKGTVYELEDPHQLALVSAFELVEQGVHTQTKAYIKSDRPLGVNPYAWVEIIPYGKPAGLEITHKDYLSLLFDNKSDYMQVATLVRQG